MKYDMKEIMTRAWAEAKETGNKKEEKSLKEKLVDKLNFIVSDASGFYTYSIYVSDWEKYGKSRTYFAVYETCQYSKHNAKYDYGFLITRQVNMWQAGMI